MQATLPSIDRRHPRENIGRTIGVYVWQYPLRLVHWGIVISIGVLSVTGYYIHDPFIIGQIKWPFLMGTFRFVHEAFGMLFLALWLTRMYLFFQGNRWERWRRYIPLRAEQWKEMLKVAKFYLFILPKPVSRIGHNALAALSYCALYLLVLVQIVTGLVLYNWIDHNALVGPLVGWLPRLINIQNIRLIHFFLMYVFISFGIFHVHLAMLISREEKHGLMDSIFIGWKSVPEHELEEDDEQAREGK